MDVDVSAKSNSTGCRSKVKINEAENVTVIITLHYITLHYITLELFIVAQVNITAKNTMATKL